MYMLAPEKYKRFSAYVIGWMSILAWWLATTSGLSQVAIASTGLAAFANPSYTPQAWHIYLCFLAMAFIAGMSTSLTRRPLLIANSDPALLILKVTARHHIRIHVSELDWFLDLVHLYASHETEHQSRFVYCRIRPRYQWLESRNSMGPRNLKCYVLLCRVGFSHTHCRRDREPGPQATCRHVSIPSPRALKF